MSIAKTLDLSIKFNETGISNKSKSYILSERQYENYIDNEKWSAFVEEMRTEYPLAYAEYGEGSGDELGIKKIGKYPPKMASYGSSSRMIYLLSRDIEGFQFEKKLPTTVGGIANIDGFLQSENIQFFIEAKCREPYSPKSYIIDRKYEALYRYIDAEPSVDIKCNITIIDDEKMRVQFVAQGTIIMAFDIKQMISHLLGIATKKLNNPTEEKIRFLYLLYNPTSIKIVNPKHTERILAAYNTQVNECNSIPFADLFGVVIDYLHDIKSVGNATERENNIIKSAFTFELCDQNNYLQLMK